MRGSPNLPIFNKFFRISRLPSCSRQPIPLPASPSMPDTIDPPEFVLPSFDPNDYYSMCSREADPLLATILPSSPARSPWSQSSPVNTPQTASSRHCRCHRSAHAVSADRSDHDFPPDTHAKSHINLVLRVGHDRMRRMRRFGMVVRGEGPPKAARTNIMQVCEYEGRSKCVETVIRAGRKPSGQVDHSN